MKCISGLKLAVIAVIGNRVCNCRFKILFLIKLIPLKKLFTALFLYTAQLTTANCQLHYWQQEVNYTIDVSLNDKEHTLNWF